MFKNMKLKASLLLGYGITIGVSLVLIVACIFSMFNAKNEYSLLLDEDVPCNEHILYARINAIMAGRNIRDALLVPDSEANEGLISTAEQCLEDLELKLQALERDFPIQLEKTKLNAYTKAARDWAANAPMLIELYQTYHNSESPLHLQQAVDFIYTDDTPLQNVMQAAAEELDDYLVQGLADERARIEQSIITTMIVTIVAVIVAIIAVISLAMAIIRSIAAPTAEVHRALVGYSQGKFDIPVEFEGSNELGEMCKAMRASQDCLKEVVSEVSYLMGEMSKGNFDLEFKDESIYVGGLADIREAIRGINYNLSDTLSQINMSAEQVSVGSAQVATGAQALAHGATEQASAVEELSATIQEISTNSQRNAQRSDDALRQSNYTNEQLDESAQNMDEMVRAMDRISDSSQEIGKIIATIENLAFQTNILALNAAVEAARAGAAGKGFAVVADEVRNLSAKSDQAAKATKELIDNSMASVQDGSKIVDRVSESLKKTVEATSELRKSIEEIAQAVAEEAESITQVTQGIEQISSVVQTNSATSEQSAATSEELSTQANMMKSLMAKFKLRTARD